MMVSSSPEITECGLLHELFFSGMAGSESRVICVFFARTDLDMGARIRWHCFLHEPKTVFD